MFISIDPEFRALIPPMTTEERTQLERSLIAEGGARDPLVLWGNVLLDGHNRYDICTRRHLLFHTTTLQLTDRDAAKIWIIENQFGRRNISNFTRIELAWKLQPLYAAAANARMLKGKAVDPSANFHQGKTSKSLAKIAGVGHRTLEKAKVLKDAPESIKEKLRRGESSIHREYTAMVQAERHEQKVVALTVARCAQTATWGDVRHCSMHDLLASLHDVDAIITDPPYGKDAVPLYGELAQAAARALKPGGVLAVMCGQMYLPELLTLMTPHLAYRWTMAYLTPGGQPTSIIPRRINAFWKPVLVFGGGEMMSDVIYNPPNDRDKAFHAWGQNEAGISILVERLTTPGALVCDPFLGGGTTAVACKALARRFVGGDIDAAAVTMTRARLGAASKEPYEATR